jgi:hypothetical protein
VASAVPGNSGSAGEELNLSHRLCPGVRSSDEHRATRVRVRDRVSFDSFAFHGTIFQVAISCTALDVFFGSMPLLWQGRRPVSGNLLFFAEYFLCLSTINLARLVLGFLLYAAGVSWLLGHEVMSGVFYFAVLVWIAGRRGWSSHR